MALRVALFGLIGPFAAAVMARYGLRAIVAVGDGADRGRHRARDPDDRGWQLWASWGLLLGVGTGLTAMVLGATVANRWFTARRGLVMGLLTASSATGALIFLPLAAWLAEHAAGAWPCCRRPSPAPWPGLLMLLVGRDHPADLGLPPYGERAVVAAAGAAPAGNAAVAALRTWRRRRARATFWLLFGTFFVCGLSTNGLIGTHFIPLCARFRHGAVPAAAVLAMMGAFDFVGTIGSGWLSDRFDSRWLLFCITACAACRCWRCRSPTSRSTGCRCSRCSTAWTGSRPCRPRSSWRRQTFGREQAAMMFGWVFCGHQLGAAVAAFGGGWSARCLGKLSAGVLHGAAWPASPPPSPPSPSRVGRGGRSRGRPSSRPD